MTKGKDGEALDKNRQLLDRISVSVREQRTGEMVTLNGGMNGNVKDT